MECNRDEALRAKEIAERKFLAKDMNGAKKFALKAQNLYPELEGISQMLMTLEVYISAEEDKIHGESNWYGVLGVTPLADDETIRKQYRKLALLLHPDKNRSVGAEGAFQLVSQAWSLLSDKSKRTAYDQRHVRNQNKNEGPSMQNGFYNFANNAASQVRVPKDKNSKRNPSSGPNASRKKDRHTFWTVCHRCKMQYEYLRMYLNHNLLCPNCHEAYFAVEIDPPSTKGSKVTQTSNSQRRKNISQQESELNHNGFQWVPFTEPTGGKSAVQAANMVQQAYEKVKRERQKAQAAARREEALLRKNLASKRAMGGESSGQVDASKRRKGVEDCGMNKDKMEWVNSESGQVNFSGFKHDGTRKRTKCHVGIKDLLIEKARDEVHKKLSECISAAIVRNEAGEEVRKIMKEKETATINDGIVTDGIMCNQNKLCESLESESQFPPNKMDSYLDRKLVEKMSIDVLDPDFYDFDKCRTEKCFGENQIWAVYDDDDGMPRHYAMIQNVMSINPFKVKMSWLSSLTRVGEVSWFLSGFSKTWGEFGVGKHEICGSIDCFSHEVRWTKSKSKTILVFPKKGDVWALYRNWSPEWNELTEDEVIHKYDMVEVLEDYDEELGVIVIPLVKVAGFKAVFHQSFNPAEIQRIPKEEMSRFSHQVPSHLLTGQEGTKSPKGCLELDPAAIPLHFLQAMSNVEGIEFLEIDEDIEFVKAVDCDHSTSTNMVEGIS